MACVCPFTAAAVPSTGSTSTDMVSTSTVTPKGGCLNNAAWRGEARPRRHQSGSVVGLGRRQPTHRRLMACPEPPPSEVSSARSFATATAVQPAAAGEWSASIDPGWDIAGNANGGHLLAWVPQLCSALLGGSGV